MNIKHALVTGGAGFVGSNLVDALVKAGVEVTVIDNLSTGKIENLPAGVRFIEEDFITIHEQLLRSWIVPCDYVFHFQANADVRGGEKDSFTDFQQNIVATRNLLEACGPNIKGFTLASSATVYGEPSIIPTPETYHGRQTSHYGASKLACEAMVEAYCNYTGMAGSIFRFPSIIGERYTHGIIFDVMKKLINNPFELELLGDGTQAKSFIYVGDVVAGVMKAIEKQDELCSTFNVGNDQWLTVAKVVQTILNELELNPAIKYAGGQRGWIGDSPVVRLDSSRLKDMGWQAETSITAGIFRTVRWLQQNRQLLK